MRIALAAVLFRFDLLAGLRRRRGAVLAVGELRQHFDSRRRERHAELMPAAVALGRVARVLEVAGAKTGDAFGRTQRHLEESAEAGVVEVVILLDDDALVGKL